MKNPTDKQIDEAIINVRNDIERFEFDDPTDSIDYEYGNLEIRVGDLKTILTALEMAKGDKWQPIETAPKDGAEILLMLTLPSGNINVVHNCQWLEDNDFNGYWHGWEDDGAETTCKDFDPEYWMPCQPPPKTEQSSYDNNEVVTKKDD